MVNVCKMDWFRLQSGKPNCEGLVETTTLSGKIGSIIKRRARSICIRVQGNAHGRWGQTHQEPAVRIWPKVGKRKALRFRYPDGRREARRAFRAAWAPLPMDYERRK